MNTATGQIRLVEMQTPRTGRIWFGTDRNTVGLAEVRPADLRP